MHGHTVLAFLGPYHCGLAYTLAQGSHMKITSDEKVRHVGCG